MRFKNILNIKADVSHLSLILHILCRKKIQFICISASLVVTGLLENIGILMVLPALQLIDGTPNFDGEASNKILNVFGSFGVDPTFNKLIIISLLLVSLKLVISFLVGLFASFSCLKIIQELKSKIVHSVLSARMTFFGDAKVGKYINMTGAEADRALPALSNGLFFIPDVIHIGFYLISSLLVSVQITVFMIIFGILKSIILAPLVTLGRRSAEMRNSAANQFSQDLLETMQMIKPIKAMAKESGVMSKLTIGLERFQSSQKRAYLSSYGLVNFDEALITFFMVVCFLFTVNVSDMGLAELAVVGVLMSRLLRKIGQLQKRYLTILSGAVSLKQLIDHSSALQRFKEKNFGSYKASLKNEIKFVGVNIFYGELKAVENINFTIPARKITVIKGRSGVGKTTLIDSFLGLTEIHSGRIEIDGMCLSNVDMADWRSTVGYVPQDTVLFNGSIRDNVKIGVDDVSDEDVVEALIQAGAYDFVRGKAGGLDQQVGERGLQLSGGQCQRISIARALLSKPKILILDEATSALDNITVAEICKVLASLKSKMTIIAITHRDELKDVADISYVIDERGVHQDGQC